MNKDKLVINITIGITTLILVCVIFVQFRIVNETDVAQIESMREDELKEAVVEWKEKYNKTSEKLEETNKKLKEYNDKIQSNEEAKDLIENELVSAKEKFGLTDVSGDGVIITLTDKGDKIYEWKDILELINELRAAGAEAISINNERIINMSDIIEVGSRYIVVNKEKISSPYVIKVIGDKVHLKSAVTIKNGYYDLKKKEEYSIDIQEKTNIKIEKYSKEINLKYIENV